MVTRLDAQNKYTEQYMENSSYDADFGILTREILTYNPISGSLERVSAIQGNGALTLGYDANGNLISLEKVIGSVTYTKTLTWDANGNLTNISVWT
jgi:YD repeat-containing protein